MSVGRRHWHTNVDAIMLEERAFNDDCVVEWPLAAGGGSAIRFRRQRKAEEK
jgi:hypothetical protein